MKRFYKAAAVVPLSRHPREMMGLRCPPDSAMGAPSWGPAPEAQADTEEKLGSRFRGNDGGYGIALDGRPVKTPSRRDLALPNALLAEAIADEWNAQGESVDPRAMPLTGLANAAIDRVAPDAAAFARGLAAFGESDLLYYRAEGPAPLVARQAGLWDPILAWAQQRYDAVFELTQGIIHMPQPPESIARLAAAVAAREPFTLAGLSPLVTISGSLLIALALAEGEIGLDQAWAAASLDEQWQAEQWGEDREATMALANRRADFAAAARFLSLL